MNSTRLLATIVVGLTFTGGCTQATPVAATTEEEAHQYLARIVELAQARMTEDLCELGGLNCVTFLEEEGDRAPEADPIVVGTRVRPQSADQLGGIVLELCGERDNGDWYYSEILVFHDSQDDNRVKGIEPVYWAEILMPDDGNVGRHVDFDPATRCEGASPLP